MRKILLISLLFASAFGYGHDIKMAVFEVSRNEQGLQMTISVDKDNFLEILSIQYAVSRHELENLKKWAWQYIDSHLLLTVNNTCTSFIIDTFEYGEQNIVITGKLDFVTDQIQEVQIENYCLVDVFTDHENIMKLKLNGSERSFRLNKDRTATMVEYGI